MFTAKNVNRWTFSLHLLHLRIECEDNIHENKRNGGFPLSRNLYVCTHLKFMRANKRNNVWSVTRKRKSWTVHYFYFICGRKFQTRKHVKNATVEIHF